jgi:hypothetical protein
MPQPPAQPVHPIRNMRRAFLALVLVVESCVVAAAGLGAVDRAYVDGVSVDASTGAVTLLLVVDFPLEDGLTKPRARSKILSYVQWMRSKRFAEAYPNAKPSAGLILLIAHAPPQNALGRSVLEQIEGYARELGFATKLQMLEQKAKPK